MESKRSRLAWDCISADPVHLPTCCWSLFIQFSSSSPSLLLLPEADAAFGDDGGEVLLKGHWKVGDCDRSLVGLLEGLCLGDKAWSIRLPRSWKTCFCRTWRYKKTHNNIVTLPGDKQFMIINRQCTLIYWTYCMQYDQHFYLNVWNLFICQSLQPQAKLRHN